MVALPLNIFSGAGVPAGLLILGQERPKPRRDKLQLVYVARHFGRRPRTNSARGP